MTSASSVLAERALALSSVPLFEGMDLRVLQEVASRVDELYAPAGADVVREGDPGDALYVILRGRAETLLKGGRSAGVLGPGEIFGELSALDPSLRSATVRALEDLFLLRLHREVLLELLAERAEIGQALLSTLSGRLRRRLEGARDR